jgi:hypothetical protein
MNIRKNNKILLKSMAKNQLPKKPFIIKLNSVFSHKTKSRFSISTKSNFSSEHLNSKIHLLISNFIQIWFRTYCRFIFQNLKAKMFYTKKPKSFIMLIIPKFWNLLSKPFLKLFIKSLKCKIYSKARRIYQIKHLVLNINFFWPELPLF